MAGPRISPKQTFRTATGRQLPADEMKAAIHRLNTQHTYLDHHSTNVGFQATSPRNMEALTVRPPSAPAVVTAGKKLKLTRIVRQEFDTRPQTAGACPTQSFGHRPCVANPSKFGPRPRSQSRVIISLSTMQATSTRYRDNLSMSPLSVNPGILDRRNCTSDFARKLTMRQQAAAAQRLSNSHRLDFAEKSCTDSNGRGHHARNMQRNLSLWERPGEVCHQHHPVQVV